MQLFGIQLLHTILIAWLYFCLGYMIYAHLTSRWDLMLGVAYVSVALEGIVVLPLSFLCPLTLYVQETYGLSVNDSFIPSHIAQWIMPLGIFLCGVSLAIVPLRWLYLRRNSAHEH